MDERDGDGANGGGLGAAGWNDTRRVATADRIARAVEDLAFDRATFPGWIKRGTVKYDNNGNCEVAFTVAAEHRGVFAELGKAMRVPLLITIEKFDGTER
jgi:hypothetical protein